VDWISHYRTRVEEGTNAEPSGNGRTIDLVRNALATIKETTELGENPKFVETLNSMWGTLADDHIIQQINEEGNLIKIPSSTNLTSIVSTNHTLYKDNFTCLFSAVIDNSGVIAESMGEKIVFTNPVSGRTSAVT